MRREGGAGARGDEGTLFADRFELGAPLGAGGMGEVFRATDRRSGRVVAVKLLRASDPEAPAAARFAAEIDVLAELAHPAIVAYVAHGAADDGRPFLAMECLEGEVLTKRLERGPLSVADTLTLVGRVADALHAAHRRGLVHRDVKPSNLFLKGAEAAGVTVLDFGLVRAVGGERALTQSGMLVGTPEYMAPEQAQGLRTIGPAADVFALGCVFYQCLTGRSPFAASHLVATLGKVLFGEPVSLDAARPDLPAPLRALVAQMLLKDPLQRPRDGGAVAEALAGLAPLPPTISVTASAPLGLGARELELVSVIVVSLPGGADDATLVVSDASTPDADAAAVVRAIAARGVRTERLADGSIVATLGPGASAVDLALQAVSLAQRALVAWPAAVVAVATARGVAGERLPLGEALERAAALLTTGSPSGQVRLDDVTAALVDGRVVTVESADGWRTLDALPVSVDASRPLLGRATPCVGREQELSLLEMTMAASFDEGTARAVLVVGGAGLGKSRLRHELLRRAAQREGALPVLRLEAKGELLRAASPLGLVAQALRRHFGVTGDEGAEVARSKLVAGVSAMLPAAAAQGVAELLGELCDLPFPDEESVRLRAARQDPRVMQARTSEAFLEYLRAATEGHGVCFVLEDLHWGDRASMGLIELALREFAERPLFVVAFARPEVHELAPELWKGRVTLLPLRPLGRRACERLATAVAGDVLDPAAIARIAEQSDGNALYLEELVRSACHGDGDTPPATVLAMLQARIGWLETGVRRVLRAASVFGESFALEGVRAVLGADPGGDGEHGVSDLVREEIVEAQRDAPGSYRIRHALMRDAAYGLLTEDDRRLGHQLAAGWLAAREADPALIAEHHLLAGSADDAAPWFVRAAHRAFDRGEFRACEALARRGRAAGARGEARGALGALESFCAVTRWDWTAGGAAASEAAALLPAGSTYWCYAQRTVALLAAYRNAHDALRACVEGFLAAAPLEDSALVYGDTAIHLASAVIQVGSPGLGLALLSRAEATLGELLPRYPMLLAWLNVVHCTHERHTQDTLAPQLALLREAIGLFDEGGGSSLMAVFSRDNLGELECRAGDLAAGEARLRGSHADALAMGVGMAISHAALSLANGLLARGSPDAVAEAARLAGGILATPGISDGYQAMARDVLAETLLARGAFDDAEREARSAVALSPHTPVRRWLMQSRWSRALLGLGRVEEGWLRAFEAVEEMDAAGFGGGYAELPLLLAAASAARRSERAVDAERLDRRAEAWIARQSAAFEDPIARAAYLARVAPGR
ncbi:MAG: protein kinase [Myxococcales bacterium]|nr:protein kinase [Myxococcales bacterium]